MNRLAEFNDLRDNKKECFIGTGRKWTSLVGCTLLDKLAISSSDK
jgi:hypothetical protein